MFDLPALLLILFAYLIGSISSARIVCLCLRLPSPTSVGSGNPGTTNVLRIGGKKAALLTFLGDAFKGVIPVLVGHAFGLPMPMLSVIALLAVIGHMYPIYHRFSGGKGVATMMGIGLALNPWLGMSMIATWIWVAVLLRYSSLAALVSCILMPLYAHWLIGDPSSWVLGILTLLILFKHHGNIQRLLTGQESKIGKKVKA